MEKKPNTKANKNEMNCGCASKFNRAKAFDIVFIQLFSVAFGCEV